MPPRTIGLRAFALAVGPCLLAGAAFRPTPVCAAKDWPPLPPEQRTLAQPLVERDADAEALLWEVQVEDRAEGGDVVSIRDHFMRVKVFTAKGAQEWSKRDVDYPRDGASISDLAARTHKPDGTVLVMDRKAVSEVTLVKTSAGSLKRTSFALPGVEPGCIVEYRYREYHRGSDVYASIYPLQMDVPVEKVVYRVRPLSISGLYMRQLTFHAAASSRDVAGGYLETTALSQRAFVTEPDMPPEAQQLGFMVLFYTTEQNTSPEVYWPEVGKARADWFDGQSKPDDRMRAAAQALVQGATSDRERLERIAGWLRREFRVVRSASRDSLRAHGLSDPADARQAWRQKGGRYLDGELVFASLARAAGLEVRWIMVPTRSRIFFNPNMLHEGFLDSYQIAVRLDGRWTTFDPVARYLPWDMRPWDEEASMGLLCDRDSTRFIETGYSEPEHTMQIRNADLELQPDGTLTGTLRLFWSGHLNAEFRDAFEDARSEELDSLATATQAEGGTDVRLTGVTLLRGDDECAPLGITARVELPRFASVTGKRILLEPAVFCAHEKPRFTSTARRHPVYFRFPWTELDTVRVRLPAGWKVESVNSVQPLSAEGVADYQAAVMLSDDETQVLFVRRFRMGIGGSIYFATPFYSGVKQLFDGIQKRDGVALSLARADSAP